MLLRSLLGDIKSVLTRCRGELFMRSEEMVVRALNNHILGYFCSNDNTLNSTPFYRLLVVLNIKSTEVDPFFFFFGENCSTFQPQVRLLLLLAGLVLWRIMVWSHRVNKFMLGQLNHGGGGTKCSESGYSTSSRWTRDFSHQRTSLCLTLTTYVNVLLA